MCVLRMRTEGSEGGADTNPSAILCSVQLLDRRNMRYTCEIGPQ